MTEALEYGMANRGFVVFKNERQLEVDDFPRASRWWGGKDLHGTHGVHPATPGGNPHIFHLSNDMLNAGLENGYATACEYQESDCVFIDNPAVAHRATAEAHLPAEEQGLRIVHRGTVRGVQELAPDFGLLLHVDVRGASPFGEGVRQGGGIGFRRDQGIPMQS